MRNSINNPQMSIGDEPLGEPWFPVKITGELATGDTGLDVTSYSGVEVWVQGDGTTVEKTGGRVLGTANPGVPLDTTTTFAVDDLALARSAHGAGGLLWELVPYRSASSSTPSGSVPCRNLGWLRSGPRSNKAWKVSVVEALGECDCTPLTADGEELYAIYNATDSAAAGPGIDIWDVVGNIVTCCGCATAQIKVTHASRLAQLILTYKSCDDGSTQTVTIDAECGGDGYVIFDVYKEDLCEAPTPPGNYACTSLFRVKAECVDCDLANAECALCATDKGPAVWKVIGSGFSGDHSDYNGTWYLTSTSACTWSVTCGGVTVSLALSDVNPSSPSSGLRYTLTFSGAAGGSVVYTLDDTDRACDQNHTLAFDSGDDTESPATVDIVPLVCDPLEDFCQQLIDEGATFTATITNKTGLCTCVGDSYGPFVYDPTLGVWHTGPEGDPDEFPCSVLDCEENAEIIITCTNGQLQFGAGGAQTLVSYTRDPFLWVADKSIDAGNGPGGYRVTITKN